VNECEPLAPGFQREEGYDASYGGGGVANDDFSDFPLRQRKHFDGHVAQRGELAQGLQPPTNHLGGRGSHSLTSKLNLSALYWTGGALRDCVARVKGVLGGI